MTPVNYPIGQEVTRDPWTSPQDGNSGDEPPNDITRWGTPGTSKERVMITKTNDQDVLAQYEARMQRFDREDCAGEAAELEREARALEHEAGVLR